MEVMGEFRSSGREEAIKILYFLENDYELQKSILKFEEEDLETLIPIEDLVEKYETIHPCNKSSERQRKTRDYALKIVSKVYDNKREIDKDIIKFSKIRIQRIDIITLCILRLGICQFAYFNDIPSDIKANVIISECVKWSKIYEEDVSTTGWSNGGPSFINGILDRIFHEKIAG